ncbi:MAG: redoxin domain-containing protein [Planctomycetes bacterium]|nr:redoxin domain-containing protein [Planctomycetota bacterium]
MAQVPHLVEIQNNFGSKGLQIITVTTDDPSIVPGFIQQHRINYGVVAHKTMGQIWGVTGVPASFLVNPEGKVVWKGHPSGLNDGMLSQHMGLQATSSDVLSTPPVTDIESDGSGKWLLAIAGAAVFFAGAMFFFWWKTRPPKWEPDYAAFDPKEVKKQQIREQMAQHDPQQQQQAAEGGVGAAQQVHVGQTRDFANAEIVSRMEFQERPDSAHMGGGTVDPGNTSSTPGVNSFVRPSTGSTPAVASGPHSKPKLNRTDGHLSSGVMPSAAGSRPQPAPLSPQPQQLNPELGQQPPALNPQQQPPQKGNTQFRPYDPQQGGHS